MERFFYDVHSGTEIIVRAQKDGQKDDDKTACRDTEPRIWKKPGVKVFDSMHGTAEQDAHKGAERRKDDDLYKGGKVQL